jgi:hypothetical protein
MMAEEMLPSGLGDGQPLRFMAQIVGDFVAQFRRAAPARDVAAILIGAGDFVHPIGEQKSGGGGDFKQPQIHRRA